MANEERAVQADHVAAPQEVLVGFIASDTSLGVDDKGQDVFKARFKSRGPSIRTEAGWERGETVYGNLRVYGPKAEMASQKFRDMDAFIASGHEESYPRDDGTRELFFFADDIGHNPAFMDYMVDRTRQIEQKKIWDQQRDTRRAQESDAHAPQTSEPGMAPSPSAEPVVQPAQRGFVGAADAPPAPLPTGGVGAIVAREALMQNEGAYAPAAPSGHDAPSR